MTVVVVAASEDDCRLLLLLLFEGDSSSASSRAKAASSSSELNLHNDGVLAGKIGYMRGYSPELILRLNLAAIQDKDLSKRLINLQWSCWSHHEVVTFELFSQFLSVLSC